MPPIIRTVYVYLQRMQKMRINRTMKHRNKELNTFIHTVSELFLSIMFYFSNRFVFIIACYRFGTSSESAQLRLSNQSMLVNYK